MTRLNVIGQTFGHLTAVADSERTRGGRRMVECICSCGSTIAVEPRDLRRGHAKSCGCQRRVAVGRASAARVRHGQTASPEHNSWVKMRARCYNAKNRKYADYGGRGITVSDAWRGSFEQFLADMGPKPFPEASLDRIDVDGPYSAENCRWASAKVQSRNKRNHRLVEHDGRTMPLSEACELAGVNYRSAMYRLNTGKPWLPAAPVTKTEGGE